VSIRTAFGAAARLAAVLLLLTAGGCARRPVPEAELAAAYEAFLWFPAQDFADKVLVQDSTMPVTVGMFAEPLSASRDEISPFLSPEVHEAIRDLVGRSRTPVRLPAELEVATGQQRISPDSVRKLFELIRVRDLHRLPDRAEIVQFSGVGFNRDRSVAVVVQTAVCGLLCGGSMGRAVRKHPGGWMAAEELFNVIY
jgi:hypothetical protein